MNPGPDDDLRSVFARSRRCDHEHAPAWRLELLLPPAQPSHSAWRSVPVALAAACVILLAFFFIAAPKQEPPLSEALPPLLDSPPGQLFAGLEPSLLTFKAPSDFLLPDHLTTTLP